MQPIASTSLKIQKCDRHGSRQTLDAVAVEEPLEMRLWHGSEDNRSQFTVAITMRTPGSDRELAAGYLHGEGLLKHKEQLLKLEMCGPIAPGARQQNVVRIELQADVPVDRSRFSKHAFTNSACGICGKTSLDAMVTAKAPGKIQSMAAIPWKALTPLPKRLQEAQETFNNTGGVHACGLFTREGELLFLEEDIGRHNAVDKVIGRCLLSGLLPLNNHILVVSGRAGFELVQKAVMADVGIFLAVGAPSNLSYELAERFGMSLVGFARDDRLNIYVDRDRILI